MSDEEVYYWFAKCYGEHTEEAEWCTIGLAEHVLACLLLQKQRAFHLAKSEKSIHH